MTKRTHALAIVIALAAATLAAGAADTVEEREVTTNERVEIRNFKGTVLVVAHEDDLLRVEADHASQDEIVVERRGDVWIVVPASWAHDSREFALRLPDMARVRVEGPEPAPAHLTVSIPSWMPVEVETPFGDVSVEGAAGPVEVTAMMGNVTVKGAGSPVRLRTMTGRIDLSGAGGRIALAATQGRIAVRDTSGEIRAETTTGNIVLEALDGATDVEATTIDGNVVLRGALTANGRYELTTHGGNVDLTLDEPLDAWFSVRALTGRFDSNLALDDPPENGRGEFTLGRGSARLLLESFSGRIRLSNSKERVE